MDSFRKHYFEALGTRDADKLKDACARTHEIRKFEIELYWKRATYFWALQLIAFTALGFVLKDGQVKARGLLLVAEAIGVITAFAGYLTACGSKFWQENWEAHMDMLENELGARLTQVIMCPKSSPQFSVSRINQSLLLLLTLGWSAAFFCGAIPRAAEAVERLGSSSYSGAVALVAAAAVCGWMWRSNRTRLSGRSYKFGEKNWRRYGPKSKHSAPAMIWRDPLGLAVNQQEKPGVRGDSSAGAGGSTNTDAC